MIVRNFYSTLLSTYLVHLNIPSYQKRSRNNIWYLSSTSTVSFLCLNFYWNKYLYREADCIPKVHIQKKYSLCAFKSRQHSWKRGRRWFDSVEYICLRYIASIFTDTKVSKVFSFLQKGQKVLTVEKYSFLRMSWEWCNLHHYLQPTCFIRNIFLSNIVLIFSSTTRY